MNSGTRTSEALLTVFLCHRILPSATVLHLRVLVKVKLAAQMYRINPMASVTMTNSSIQSINMYQVLTMHLAMFQVVEGHSSEENKVTIS